MEKSTVSRIAQQSAVSALEAIRTARSMGMVQTDVDLQKILTSCFEVVIEEVEQVILGSVKEENKINLDIPVVGK